MGLQGIALACARHPWRTIAAWIALVVLAVLAIATTLAALTTEGNPTNDPQSQRAEDALAAAFPPTVGAAVTDVIVVRSDRYRADTPRFDAVVRTLAGDVRSAGGVDAVRSYLDTRDPALVSRDRRAAMVQFADASDSGIDHVVAAVGRADALPGFDASVTGQKTIDRDFNSLSESDLQHGELQIGLPAALIVLLLVFGSVVAGLMPLMITLPSIVVALGLVALLAQAFNLSIFVVNMLTGMGLALGIDYALFVVSRFREERGGGREQMDAITATAATANRAVVFSGTTFVIAMFGMLVVPNSIMRSLAVGAIVVGAVSVVASATLLPALLGLIGDGVDRWRIPFFGRRSLEQSNPEGRFWGRIVRGVLRRPGLSLALAVAVLLALASPVLGMHVGTSGVTALPDRFESVKGYAALQRDFPRATTSPVEIVVDRGAAEPATRAALARLRTQLASDPLFGAGSVIRSRDGTVAAARGAGAGRPVRGSCRRRCARPALAGHPPDVRANRRRGPGRRHDVGEHRLFRLRDRPGAVGDRARARADARLPDDRLPLARGRGDLSAAQPAVGRRRVRAARARLPARCRRGHLRVRPGRHDRGVGAALPLLRAVRALDGLPGLPAQPDQGTLRRASASRPDATTQAVVFGVASTARIITGAALIIVAVFAGFASGELIMFQQMGFGVAVALLIDATIIRSVVLPATMHLLGRWNWYLPHWLDWLPRVQIEARAETAGAASR